MICSCLYGCSAENMSDHFGISKQFPDDGSKVKVDNVNRADTAMLDIITTKMSEKQEIYKVSDEW